MDKRALLAIVLSFAVLAVWGVFLAPRPPLKPPAGDEVPSPEQIQKRLDPPDPSSSAAESTEVASSRPAPMERREAAEGAPPAIVETDLYRVEISSVGGRVASWILKGYRDYEGNPYELVSPASPAIDAFPLQFRLEDESLEDLLNTRARFVLETARPGEAASASGEPVSAGGSGSPVAEAGLAEAAPGSSPRPGEPAPAASAGEGGTLQVRAVYADGQGLEVTKTFSFEEETYLVQVHAQILLNGEPVEGQIVWGPGVGTPSAEELAGGHYDGGHVVSSLGGKTRRFKTRKVAAPLALADQVRWAGIEEQYFAAVFLPANGLGVAEVVPSLVPPPAPPDAGPPPQAGAPAELVRRLSIAVPLGRAYFMFAGPKDFHLLAGLQRGLTDLVNFEPPVPVIGPIIGVLAKILYGVLRWLYSFVPNYGIAVILITTAIKIIFYPLTQRAMVKMRAVQQQMQKVQPKVKAIREKHKKAKDHAARSKMNEEIMNLYRREGINPMASLGGCLPLLLQLPILYAFYSVLTVSIELRQAPFFGWIQDLSRRDPLYITPVVMGISMFVQQKMAMTSVTDPQQRAQQRMMLFMPLIFTWTFLHLPSGLVLYWFVNNLLGIAQQVLINRQAAALKSATAAGKA